MELLQLIDKETGFTGAKVVEIATRQNRPRAIDSSMSCSRTIRNGHGCVLSFQNPIQSLHQLFVSVVIPVAEFTHISMVCIHWLSVFMTQFQKRGMFVNDLIQKSVTSNR